MRSKNQNKTGFPCRSNRRAKDWGSRLQPKPLAGAATSRRGRPRAWLAPAGAAPASIGSAGGQAAGGGCPLQGCKGSPTARAAACKDDRLQERPLAGAAPARCHPRAAAHAVGATAHTDDIQRRRLRKAMATTQVGARGLGHPFRKWTILPL
ncbi:hypothetical protein BHE74_00027817 [Ensete ventricosum]|nr:hypothetical protein BHE74_00027817 [Ensete ventricosum]